MRKFGQSFLILAGMIMHSVMAQYAPPAGLYGSTAIHADSSVFVAWSVDGVVQRGFMKADEPDLGFASYGEIDDAFGKADLHVVSLGDAGSIVLEFEHAVINGPGPDFAVFENSFSDTFLELALVEVSTDGVHFALFPSVSLTQTNLQVDGFGIVDATKVHNLAGKYRAMYGVPFDLEAIISEHVDVNDVRFIRLTDVTGSVDPVFGSKDSLENIINDPWPTPFPSSGFDLDAVGIIHDRRYLSVNTTAQPSLKIFPNPCYDNLEFQMPCATNAFVDVQIFELSGKKVFESKSIVSHRVDIGFLSKGLYIIHLNQGNISYQNLIMKL